MQSLFMGKKKQYGWWLLLVLALIIALWIIWEYFNEQMKQVLKNLLLTDKTTIMKQMLSLISIGLLSLLFNPSANAQSSPASTIAYTHTANVEPVFKAGDSEKEQLVYPVNLNELELQFGEVSNLQWITSKEGNNAYFNVGEKKCRAFYNKKNRLVFSISQYANIALLPASLRQQLEATYPNRTLFSVFEIGNGKTNSYRLLLKNNTSMLTVMYKDGEVQELEKIKLTE